jgi:hypothetical protein
MSEALFQFIEKINKAKGITPFIGRLLALDPGETTGWAILQTQGVVKSFDCGQEKTWPEAEAVKALSYLIPYYLPTILVYESYHIYDWKSDDHKWSSVHTVQVIGAIWTLCELHNIPYHTQTAQNAKGFWDDAKLKSFPKLYRPGLKHGRDAMRHGLHYLCFGGGNG